MWQSGACLFQGGMARLPRFIPKLAWGWRISEYILLLIFSWMCWASLLIHAESSQIPTYDLEQLHTLQPVPAFVLVFDLCTPYFYLGRVCWALPSCDQGPLLTQSTQSLSKPKNQIAESGSLPELASESREREAQNQIGWRLCFLTTRSTEGIFAFGKKSWRTSLLPTTRERGWLQLLLLVALFVKANWNESQGWRSWQKSRKYCC